MKHPDKMTRTGKLVEGALMVALAFALSCIPPVKLPFGGSITFFSTLPIIVMSLRHSAKWGIGTAAVYAFTQMLQGMDSVLYLKTIVGMVLCALLDYLLAYTAVGLTGPIARRFKNPTVGLVAGIMGSGVLRFACSFASGMILWYEYAGDQAVWLYSLTYNASWWLPDIIIVLVAALALNQVKILGLSPREAEIA